jgi:superfamily II DNA or RNA helicase
MKVSNLLYLILSSLAFNFLAMAKSERPCIELINQFLEHHRSQGMEISPTQAFFVKDTMANTLGTYAFTKSDGLRNFEFSENKIGFPQLKGEKIYTVIFDGHLENAFFEETLNSRTLYMNPNVDYQKKSSLLRQLLSGSLLHSYITSDNKILERQLLELPPMNLKEVQLESSLALIETMGAKVDKKFLFVAPTGVGKTEIFKSFFKNLLRTDEREADPRLHIIISDQIGLTSDLSKAIKPLALEYPAEIITWGGEQKSFSAADLINEYNNTKKSMILATTIQSFKTVYANASDAEKRTLKRILGGVFFDEAHHTGADGASKLLEELIDQNTRNKRRFLLGTTATPIHRSKEIVGIFDNKAFYAYLDTAESYLENSGQAFRDIHNIIEQLVTAIKKGELTPFKSASFFTPKILGISESELYIHHENSSRFNLNPELYDKIFTYLHDKITSHEHGMITCADIEEAKRIGKYLNKNSANLGNKKFAVLHSELSSKEKNKIKEDYEAGRINFLITVRMLDEGVRFKHMDLYIDLNRSIGTRAMLQRIGRVLGMEQNKFGVEIVSFLSESDETHTEEIAALLTRILDGELSLPTRGHHFIESSEREKMNIIL